jgi:hypothetical protein
MKHHGNTNSEEEKKKWARIEQAIINIIFSSASLHHLETIGVTLPTFEYAVVLEKGIRFSFRESKGKFHTR